MRGVVIGALLAAGCASSAPHGSTPLDAQSLASWADDAAEVPEATVVRRERFETVRVAAAPVAADRVARLPYAGRGPRVDVRLERAPLSNALRLLADAANLSIVIGEGVEAEVSVDLRQVRPLEAMHALADAHHVDIAIVGRTVVAQRRDGT
ncbi:MAG: hypothetical protein H6719_05830 [Sandaracinaceae bacterium]|nr:hypothetical protein [Sandaracinaceae bacterium]